jgi:subtilisin family serine protease
MTRTFAHLSRLAVLAALACTVTLALGGTASASTRSRQADAGPVTVVGYKSVRALRRAVAQSGSSVVRRIRALHVAVLRTPSAAARALDGLRGIRYSRPPVLRHVLVDPAIAPAPVPGGAFEWQYAAARENLVPASVSHAASAITIAVIDTGADVSAPDLAAKMPTTWSVRSSSTDVTDYYGHGTFVSSLATGSTTNAEGIAGFGGDARLLAIQAAAPDGTISDVDESAAMVYAVDHGAKIINMSFGGPTSSPTEQSAIAYAAAHGVLLVAAAGNSGQSGDQPSYPAALLQPLGSNGQGGIGLAVAATNLTGARASFSNYGSYISLAAPGENVFGAISSTADPSYWPRQVLPGSSAGIYGFGSGTSYSSPEVAGAAALVWAANPDLGAAGVAGILKQSTSGHGGWNQDTGFGNLDVAAAVARAQGTSVAVPTYSAVKLDLRASPSARKKMRLSAVFAATSRTVARAGRRLALESFYGHSWHRFAVASTDKSGVATWTLALRRGSYRIRASYAGADDLAPATSRVVTLRVR